MTLPGTWAREIARPRMLVLLFALLALLRLWTIANVPLATDEAYYWVWSRHLALSYFDHPPMVAWWIRASTTVFGSTEFGVRLPAVIASFASVAVLMWTAARIWPGSRAPWWTGLFLLSSPLTAGVGSVMTPDAPMWFFHACAVAAAVAATSAPEDPAGRRSSTAWWLLFGVAFGLALLSKYTAVLLGGAVFLALASSARGRSELRRPGFWLGALVVCAVFAPVLYWNYTHDWASFRFQFRHGLRNKGQVLRHVGEYLGGQVLIATPVLFGLMVAALADRWRRWRESSLAERVLLWSACVPLGFFLYSATRHKVELNWPIAAYAALMVLAAAFVAARPEGARARVATFGIALSLALTILAHFPAQIARAGVPLGHFSQLWGYRELAAELDRVRMGRPVFACAYQDAAELSFYLSGQPEVWSLPLGGRRTNFFDHCESVPAFDVSEGALFVNTPRDEIALAFEDLSEFEFPTSVAGRVVRTDRLLIAKRSRTPHASLPDRSASAPAR